MSMEEKSYLKSWLLTVATSLTVVLLTQSAILIWAVSAQNQRFEHVAKTVDVIVPQHHELWYVYQHNKNKKEGEK